MRKYQYNKSHHKRRRQIIRVALTSAVIFIIIGSLVSYDLYRHHFRPVDGVSQTVIQGGTANLQKSIDEPTYSFKLPSDWKEIKRVNAPTDHSVTWQASKKDEDNRYLQIYTDTIPDLAVNMVLPVQAVNETITYDDLSDNCAAFTKGGSFDASVTIKSKETPAKWQEVDFICDLPKPDYGVIGTSSKGGINSVTVTGPTKGKHKYFFVYTDHNIKPNTSIFYDVLTSFRAK